jgi:hypothetical protein
VTSRGIFSCGIGNPIAEGYSKAVAPETWSLLSRGPNRVPLHHTSHAHRQRGPLTSRAPQTSIRCGASIPTANCLPPPSSSILVPSLLKARSGGERKRGRFSASSPSFVRQRQGRAEAPRWLISFPTPIRSALFFLYLLVWSVVVSNLFLLCCFVLDSRERGNQRDRDRERAAARKPNAKGPQDGLTPEQRRERCVSSIRFYSPYVSCLICSVSDTTESRFVPADPLLIRLVGSLLVGTRKRWRRRRLRRRSRRRPAPPVRPRTTRTRAAARSRRHWRRQRERRNLCTIIDAISLYLRIYRCDVSWVINSSSASFQLPDTSWIGDDNNTWCSGFVGHVLLAFMFRDLCDFAIDGSFEYHN